MNPSPIDLTTVDAVASWLASPVSKMSAAEQDVIQRAITAASAYWLWRTGMNEPGNALPAQSPFVEVVDFDEIYNGNDANRLVLRHRPITSVATVEIDGAAVQQSLSPRARGWVIDAGKAIALRGGLIFNQDVQNVRVVYTAGFPPNVAVSLETIPDGDDPTIRLTPWLANTLVQFFVGGDPLTKVDVAPNSGEYFLVSPGVYLFSTDDAGEQVLINYTIPGTPPDILLAATQMVGVTVKRRDWIDQVSQLMGNGAGSIKFRDWELPPEVVSVMNNYSRLGV